MDPSAPREIEIEELSRAAQAVVKDLGIDGAWANQEACSEAKDVCEAFAKANDHLDAVDAVTFHKLVGKLQSVKHLDKAFRRFVCNPKAAKQRMYAMSANR